MDPKMTANRSQSDQQTATATDGQPATGAHSAAANKLASSSPGTATRRNEAGDPTAPEADRRVSVDPMRSTDRYRLAHPTNPIL